MLLLAGAFDRDRRQFPAPHPRLDQAPHRRFARRVEMADGIEADDALRTQRAVEQVVAVSVVEAGFGGLSQPKCRVISS
jgi:hypothetical protein